MLMYLLAATKDFDAVFPTRSKFVSDSMFKNFSEFKNIIMEINHIQLL